MNETFERVKYKIKIPILNGERVTGWEFNGKSLEGVFPLGVS